MKQFQWHRGGQRWRLSSRSASILAACALAALCLECVALSLRWPRPSDKWWVSATVAMSLLGEAVAATAFFSYLHVSMRAARPSQLHLHGMTLLISVMAFPCYLLSENLLLQGMCGAALAAAAAAYSLAVVGKGAVLLLVGQKIMALGPNASGCHMSAHHWNFALVGSWSLLTASAASLFAWTAAIAFRRDTCERLLAAASLTWADKAVVLSCGFMMVMGAIGYMIAGTETLRIASRLRHRTVSKLAERQVQPEELSKVQTTLSQHVLGIFVVIVSTQISVVLGFLDGVNGLGKGRETLENFFVFAAGLVDLLGDVAGILLLSGIGVLLLYEDPAAGDVSAHIYGVLHSAVLTSRAEIAFEGRVEEAAKGSICVASFPGKYLGDWNALTWACELGDISSACVFLPTGDAQGRFGQHEPRPETPGKCWCSTLYGEEKKWGCLWFRAWQRNIELAVERQLELVVVFFPGQAGEGVVAWDSLGLENLWDGVGLGGSQKAELAYLKMRGLHVIEEDLSTFRRRVDSLSPHRRTGLKVPRQP